MRMGLLAVSVLLGLATPGWSASAADAGNADAGAADAGAADAGAAGPSFAGEGARRVFERLHAAQPELPVTRVEPSAIDGLYVVRLERGAVLYVAADGRHLIPGRGFRVAGDLHAIRQGGIVNLTEQREEMRRAERLADVEREKMIVFSPDGPVKAAVNVFTDVDCGYCRRLHRHMDAINALGIEVRYLAYPRTGLASSSYRKIVNAWCADDPQRALTRLKNDQDVPSASCENPVAEQYELGQELGVRGTPAVFTTDGRYVGGYLSPADLAEAAGVTADG